MHRVGSRAKIASLDKWVCDSSTIDSPTAAYIHVSVFAPNSLRNIGDFTGSIAGKDHLADDLPCGTRGWKAAKIFSVSSRAHGGVTGCSWGWGRLVGG